MHRATVLSAAPFLGLWLLALVGSAPILSAEVVAPDPRAEGLSPEQRVATLLDRVRVEQAKIETMTADFVQDKQSELLVESQRSRGHFAFRRPDRVLWEYEEPDPMQVVVDEGEMLTWYEDLGRAELLKVGKYSDRILEYLAATNSLELLQRYFEVIVAFPEDPSRAYRLELEPRMRRVAKRLAGMTLWVDPELFIPRRFRYVEPDGDVTEYRFHEIRINPEVPESRFEIELPEDVEVRRVELSSAR